MKKVSLGLTPKSHEEVPHRVQAEFSSEDILLLERFIIFTERLKGAGILIKGMPKITNLRWTTECGMELDCSDYKDSDLSEVLHVLRPLILKNEKTSFHSISVLINKRFKDQKVGSHLKYLRKQFEDGEISQYMQIKLANQPLFDESILKLWLNSEEYHSDPEKIEEWEPIKKSLGSKNSRALVMGLLSSKVHAIFDLAQLAELIIRDSSD